MKHFITGQQNGSTITLSIDGLLYNKNCKSEDAADIFFDAIVTAKANPTDDSVDELMGYLNSSMRVANENGLEYDVETGLVYLPESSTPIPEQLVKVIEQYDEKGHPADAWLNFWKLLLINPDKRVRESLFEFIKKHNFVLTDNGYMLVYKAVEFLDEKNDSDLNTFVGASAYHVKNNWSCSTSKYAVYQTADGEYKLTKQKTLDGWDLAKKDVEFIGNLKDLVAKQVELANQDDAVAFVPRYVTWHKDNFDLDKEAIKLGIPQKKERSGCDSDPATSCSEGLHCGATSYVEDFAIDSSVILVCLVNPAHVVAVPNYDHSKMRVSEYFPFGLAERVNGKINIVDRPYLEHDYIAYEREELERQIQAINDEEERVGVDVQHAEDDRDIEEVLKALKDRVVAIA